MISMYFGLPGSGKSTLACKLAYDSLKLGRDVYINFHADIEYKGKKAVYIPNDVIGRYDLSGGLIIIDEATLFADNRNYKSFDKTEFFMLHRHYKNDIILLSQGYNAVDKKLRTLTVNLYYIQKSGILQRWVTKYFPIAYGIHFPDGDKLGEIVEGYSKPSLLTRIFTTKHIWRPRWYNCFDTFEAPVLPSLSEYWEKVKPHE